MWPGLRGARRKCSAVPRGLSVCFVVYPGLGSANFAEPSWAKFVAVPFGTLKRTARASAAKADFFLFAVTARLKPRPDEKQIPHTAKLRRVRNDSVEREAGPSAAPACDRQARDARQLALALPTGCRR